MCTGQGRRRTIGDTTDRRYSDQIHFMWIVKDPACGDTIESAKIISCVSLYKFKTLMMYAKWLSLKSN